MARVSGAARIEWPTVGLIVFVYVFWAGFTGAMAAGCLLSGTVCTGIAIALFASVQHEVIHGHPFRYQALNEALVFPALTLLVPHGRFRDTHLAHHMDTTLTDPFDDPESNYLDAGTWERLPRGLRLLLASNNTLLGRILLGPLIGQSMFMACDWRLIRSGDRAVLRAWLWHIPGLAMVLLWLLWQGTPLWAYAISVYIGLALLKIRTFLEHQAHERARARTVIVEDTGPLAFLFLNNNFHVVHHMHPKVPWYRLPGLYFANSDKYLQRNEGYRYASYGAVFRQYLWRAKDPVPHPLWRRGGERDTRA
jgi:fatty acid desaturase